MGGRFAGADWGLFVVSALAALLIHIDAHLWNDILDIEVDRYEKSQETGRARPLLQGWASISEYRKLSTRITLIVVALTALLTLERTFMPALVLIGFLFDYGYNHPRIALGHRPFTEWYMIPWLVVGVTVTVVYAATGIFSLLAFILSLLQGLLATCFAVSMMQRDVNSDRRGGKYTSAVLYPEVPHSTRYGIVTLLFALLMLFPLAGILGSMERAYPWVLITAIAAGITTLYGARIDQLCTRSLYSVFPEFEGQAQKLLVRQGAYPWCTRWRSQRSC
jgi:1,4-dihydroxy-2-naphthoate octaprenyltransferase